MQNEFCGFSYFNNVAIATKQALDTFNLKRLVQNVSLHVNSFDFDLILISIKRDIIFCLIVPISKMHDYYSWFSAMQSVCPTVTLVFPQFLDYAFRYQVES